MKFECYREWAQLPDGAASLFTLCTRQSLYLSRPWFESLTTHALSEGHTLLLACVVEEDQLLAMLPLMQQDNTAIAALRHGYTPLYSLLLASEKQAAILACLAQGLQQLACSSIPLEPIAEDDPHMIALQQALQAHGFACYRDVRFYNWFHRVNGQSFAEYMAERPARLRNTIARKQRKLAREHGYNIQLYTGSAVAAAMADYDAIYSASWKAQEQHRDLLHDLAVRLARPGWTRLAVLYIAGQPAAAQLWFVAHGKASIFRLAYDANWKAYSPGSILTHFLMQQVIDVERVEEIDFLRGNEAYKQDWMSQRRQRWALYCGCKQQQTGTAEPLSGRYAKHVITTFSKLWRHFRRK